MVEKSKKQSYNILQIKMEKEEAEAVKIQSVNDDSFKAYGRVFPEFDAASLVEAMQEMEAPADAVGSSLLSRSWRTCRWQKM